MRYGAALALILSVCWSGTHAQGRYYGKELSALSELHHGVRGRVYAVDSRTLFLKDFHYDGEGPAAYFYVGTSKTPSNVGALRLRDERGGSAPLRRYRGEGVTLSLPDGKTLRDFKWFSVYCDEYSVNFGDVSIPRDLDYPKPAKVGALRGVHGVSSDPVVVVDAQTLLVPNFSYDGEAPDAKFWVGRGDKPSPQGIRIPDENGKEAPLRKYDRKTVVLTLPGELTVFDIGHFAVWCEAFTVNFGHVTLPHSSLANVPPSLKMLGVSPQSRNSALVAGTPARARAPAPRPSLARLDATTYRPPRLGAGPLAALLDQPADRAALLHRRADQYTPPREQLVDQQIRIQPSKEIYYHRESINYQPAQKFDQNGQTDNRGQTSNEDYYQQQQQYEQQQQQQYEQQQQYQQQLQQQQLQQQQQPQQQQQQQQYQHQNLQQQQTQPQQQQHNQQQPYYPDERQLYEQQRAAYEQQLYEQQRAAYERQLLEEQYRTQFQRQPEPFQYRLLPYEYEHQGARNQRQTSAARPAQGSVDLDLIAGSGPQ